jgi:hypothetical protein
MPSLQEETLIIEASRQQIFESKQEVENNECKFSRVSVLGVEVMTDSRITTYRAYREVYKSKN